MQDKNYAIFAAMLRKRSYFVQEIFVPVNRAGVFIRENFHPGFREISGFRYEHIEIFTNGRVARRDLGNRACPVDQAYMKRPLKVFFI